MQALFTSRSGDGLSPAAVVRVGMDVLPAYLLVDRTPR